jgi:hypothetical protein
VLKYLLSPVPEILSNLPFVEGTPEEVKKELLEKLADHATRNSEERAERFLSTIRNLTAVLMCSVLEICLSDVLDVILQTKPETILSLNKNPKGANIPLENLIQDKNYQTTFDRIR